MNSPLRCLSTLLHVLSSFTLSLQLVISLGVLIPNPFLPHAKEKHLFSSSQSATMTGCPLFFGDLTIKTQTYCVVQSTHWSVTAATVTALLLFTHGCLSIRQGDRVLYCAAALGHMQQGWAGSWSPFLVPPFPGMMFTFMHHTGA